MNTHFAPAVGGGHTSWLPGEPGVVTGLSALLWLPELQFRPPALPPFTLPAGVFRGAAPSACLRCRARRLFSSMRRRRSCSASTALRASWLKETFMALPVGAELHSDCKRTVLLCCTWPVACFFAGEATLGGSAVAGCAEARLTPPTGASCAADDETATECELDVVGVVEVAWGTDWGGCWVGSGRTKPGAPTPVASGVLKGADLDEGAAIKLAASKRSVVAVVAVLWED